MDKYVDIPLSYIRVDLNIEFNFVGVEDDLLLSLSNALKWEFQKRMDRSNQPSFREERALQRQRYLDYCKEKGLIPCSQLLIDFKK